MSYKRKNKAEIYPFLSRVKNIADLIIGQKYHLRKLLKKEGSIIVDEAHDLVLKEEKDGYMFDQDSESKFSFAEFEVFLRKKS